MTRPKRLSPAAVEVLASMSFEGNLARITGGQLDRKLYMETNAALEALGGKWNRKLKAHLFDGDPRDALDQVIVDGEFSDSKRDFDLFETPPDLAAEVVNRCGVQDYDLVLEPSAGNGRLVKAVYDAAPSAWVWAVEVQQALAARLRDTYGEHVPHTIVHCGDFLTLEPEPRYRRIVTNPPFSRQQDLAHVTRAFQWLEPGGKLVAIMSAGVAFRTNRKAVEFRDLVDAHGGIIEPLPDGAFKSSGTMVRTVIVEMVK